ncbi:MAG: hypothetical protein HAW67_00570, partial [Endozoicomonadaceae bacterium]|nr:hypothetical protein [Endozoicomonadaceae bacterium]
MSRVNISTIVAEQLPEHIICDYPQFVAFLEAYYEWLHQQGVDIEGIRDVDKINQSVDTFIDFFKREFMENIPEGKVDTKFILQHIKDLYLAKGSEASYKLLFKILFDKDVEILYPSHQMLRLSNTKWIQERSIFCEVKTLSGDINDIVGKEIDIISGINTIPINVEKIVDRGNDIIEIFLNGELFDSFNIGDFIVFSDINFTAVILPTIESFEITSRGEGFRIGETYTLGFADTIAKVVQVGNKGILNYIQIITFGISLTAPVETTTIQVTPITGKENAVIKINTGVLNKYPGYYATNDNFLSGNSRLQDGFFYQAYSYVVRVNSLVEKFRDTVKSVLHPAGMALFTDVIIENDFPIIIDYEILGSIINNLVVDSIVITDMTNIHIESFKISDVEVITDLVSIDFTKGRITNRVTFRDRGGYLYKNSYGNFVGTDSYFTNTGSNGQHASYVL